ncbi:MAG: LacI family DNA-binding transcriptional regulator [Chloroflexota bacterium]
MQAIQELGYRPDQVARSLRRRRTNVIGLVVSTIENVFFTEVARAAEQAADDRGYNLIVCNTDESPEREAAYLTILNEQLIAGVILAPAPGDARHLSSIVDGKLPLVLINRQLDHIPCYSITSDDKEAAFECVNYLIRDGRSRIAAITGLPGISTTRERLDGYRRAITSAGLDHGPTMEVHGAANLEGGYRAAHELLARPNPPDAIFAFNNVMVQGAIMAIQDLGLCWPDQVDVSGFGAFTPARLYRPPLTLIAQPAREMGRRAVEVLLAQVDGHLDGLPKSTVLHNQLQPRHTWLRTGISDP